MDIVDRCQVAHDDMALMHRLSGALANLQAGTAYLDNEPDLPSRLEEEYQRMARKLDKLDAITQKLFSKSERWLKRVEEKVYGGDNSETA